MRYRSFMEKWTSKLPIHRRMEFIDDAEGLVLELVEEMQHKALMAKATEFRDIRAEAKR